MTEQKINIPKVQRKPMARAGLEGPVPELDIYTRTPNSFRLIYKPMIIELLRPAFEGLDEECDDRNTKAVGLAADHRSNYPVHDGVGGTPGAAMSGTGSRIRVLVQVNSLELGGSQINAVDLAAAVRDRGYDSVLVGPADSLPDGPSLFDVAADREVHLEKFERPTSTLGGARNLSRLAWAHRAELVHVYGTWSIRPAYWGPCFMARRPFVITVYEMEVDPSVYQAPSLIVGTGYLVDDLRDRHGPVHLISPPVDLERDSTAAVPTGQFLADHGLAADHLRLVIVSRLDGEPLRPVKTTGIDAALNAFDRLQPTDVDLVIVGTGKDEARLRKIGERVNGRLNRRACVFTGPMSDPRPAYAAADVVLGMGGSAARALSFGKPLIVAGEYGWFRTFTPETAAELFRCSFWSEELRAEPVDELTRELVPLFASAGERARLGRFGRSFAESNFGITAMAERLVTVYEEARSGYGVLDWLYDQRIEGRWAQGGWDDTCSSVADSPAALAKERRTDTSAAPRGNSQLVSHRLWRWTPRGSAVAACIGGNDALKKSVRPDLYAASAAESRRTWHRRWPCRWTRRLTLPATSSPPASVSVLSSMSVRNSGPTGAFIKPPPLGAVADFIRRNS